MKGISSDSENTSDPKGEVAVQKCNPEGCSSNVIPVQPGIQNLLKSFDSCLSESDKLIIIKGPLKI